MQSYNRYECDMMLYAIISENEELKNIITDNMNKFHAPIDLPYYAIRLYMDINTIHYDSNGYFGKYPVFYLYINLAALSANVKKEFMEKFGDTDIVKKHNENTRNFIQPDRYDYFHWYSMSFENNEPDKMFPEVLKFFLERSEFIPIMDREFGSPLESFIYHKNIVSFRWKTIKDIRDYLVREDNGLCSYMDMETKIFNELVLSGESMQYKPSDRVFYFAVYDHYTNSYHLRRDLFKSPKKQTKPAS